MISSDQAENYPLTAGYNSSTPSTSEIFDENNCNDAVLFSPYQQQTAMFRQRLGLHNRCRLCALTHSALRTDGYNRNND
jgi:hypothetical protein